MAEATVIQTELRDGTGKRVPCPKPHSDAEGRPKVGPGAFAYTEWMLADSGVVAMRRVIACRAHAPRWAVEALGWESGNPASHRRRATR